VTSGPAEILFRRDHLRARAADGAAVFARTNTFLTGTPRKAGEGEPRR
jgi:hypothetical protein